MDKEDIKLSDWQRILFGNAPVEFMAEVAIRTIIIFILLLVCVKLMGKRMAGKLTIIELSVMLTLGAIVSVPMQIPERGLLLGVLTLACAYFFQRGFNWLSVRYHSWERISHGNADIIVEDGIVQMDKLAKNRISVNQLFSNLRQEKVHNPAALIPFKKLHHCSIHHLINSIRVKIFGLILIDLFKIILQVIHLKHLQRFHKY